MRTIKGVLTEEIAKEIGDLLVARAAPVPVESYRDLVRQVARLSYLNKDHLLFFRGQAEDYQNKAGSSTVYPSIYRGERVTREQLELALSVLDTSSARLKELFETEGIDGHADVKRRRYVQWSILQHYEVCATPLLDLTHSLLVACSFAFLAAEGEDPVVLVFGLPYITNRISINSEHELVTVRLLSICPPEALRPYFQEGYLAGTEDVTMDFESKTELDFSHRLIAKFQLPRPQREFFGRGSVRPYRRDVLYPESDRVYDLCTQIKGEVDVGVSPGLIGAFLQDWTSLEGRIMQMARRLAGEERIYSVRAAVKVLREGEVISEELATELDRVRRIRNDVVHRPDRVSTKAVAKTSASIRNILPDLPTVDRRST